MCAIALMCKKIGMFLFGSSLLDTSRPRIGLFLLLGFSFQPFRVFSLRCARSWPWPCCVPLLTCARVLPSVFLQPSGLIGAN